MKLRANKIFSTYARCEYAVENDIDYFKQK